MAEPSPDSWQTYLFAGAAVFILFQMIRGWQLGIVRVLAQVLAVGAAYVAAYIAGPKLVPILRPLQFPDWVLMALGGAIVGVLVFAVITLTCAVLFKKTSDQSVAVVRLGYGAGGAFAGMLIGIFLVWVGFLGIRVLGSLVDPGMQPDGVVEAGVPKPERGRLALGLAQMKRSLENGPAGAVVEQMDPLPGTVYDTMGKIGVLVSDAGSAQRFLEYPGVGPLTSHPKLLALRDDPQIAREALARNFVALMRHPRVINLANDPEIQDLLKKLEFQKALDYAVRTPENRRVPQRDAL